VTSGRPGTLYLVATPIGNLEDISLRALRVLREATVIAAEDTRHTRKLLARHRIPGRLVSLHEHNEPARAPALVTRLLAGDSVALVSDAGTPGLSDPGMALVRTAADAGVPVVPIPGPSAVLAALVVSGLPAEPVTFLGFLPSRGAERRRALASIRDLPHTLVLFEAPHRLRETLEDLLQALGDRRIAVARELTKVHEEVYRATLSETVRRFSAEAPRGEFTLVIEGARGQARAAGGARDASVPSGRALAPWRPTGSAGGLSAGAAAEGAAAAAAAQQTAREALMRASAEGCSAQESVRRAARASGLRRNEVYRLWLAIKQGAGE
jgi:16S rRNA (cytidine1402-2'-O)-methyltransferase